jgi:hypothetical protein
MEREIFPPLVLSSAKLQSHKISSDQQTAAADSDPTRKSTIPTVEEFFSRFQEQAAKCLNNSYV